MEAKRFRSPDVITFQHGGLEEDSGSVVSESDSASDTDEVADSKEDTPARIYDAIRRMEPLTPGTMQALEPLANCLRRCLDMDDVDAFYALELVLERIRTR